MSRALVMLSHRIFKRHRVFTPRLVFAGCPACQAETDAIWAARAARDWRTDPSDPGWREQDARDLRASWGLE